ncbi:MAG: hypothetical protein ACXV2J_09485, partial [Actinomycetes bacterium]
GADGRADGGPDIDSSSSNLGPPWWTGLTAAVVLLFLCLAGGAALTLVRRRRERVGATTDGEPNETSPHPDDQSAVLHGAVTEPRSVPEQRQEF